MSRIQALFAAGALTGLVIFTLFWWGVGNSEAAVTAVSGNIATGNMTKSNETIVDAATEITTAPTTDSVMPDMQSLLEQNRQLREAVTTLLNREEEYRRQIEAANQRLLSSQNSSTSAEQDAGRWFDDEHDDDDYDEYEHDDDDHDEHDDEYEHDEHDEDD